MIKHIIGELVIYIGIVNSLVCVYFRVNIVYFLLSLGILLIGIVIHIFNKARVWHVAEEMMEDYNQAEEMMEDYNQMLPYFDSGEDDSDLPIIKNSSHHKN
ncbi:hypothetical protein ACFLZ9_02355 [Patescibacteria group bacterium]